jgi:pimeloyl-ACP methyl ester carboxylesterase
MAHGFTNDKSSNGRFDSLSKTMSEMGYDSLAFDFSGSGESDDAALTVENQVDDMQSVIDYAIENSYYNIALFGNSFGTLACLKNYREEIKTMVLVGALTDSMIYDWHAFYSEEQMKTLETKGYFYDETERKHKITKQTLLDFKEVDQDELIRDVKCPVLIIHGDNSNDKEELLLLSRSGNAIEKLPEGSKLEIIKDGKHGMHEHWNSVIELTSEWFQQFL